jgi:hypothetical protein
VAVSLSLPQNATARLKLSVGKQSRTADAKGAGANPTTVDFGDVDVPAAGYIRFGLQGMKKSGPTFGDVQALLISGLAAQDAHFSLVERRNAASVHLFYPVPAGTQVAAFYNEVTVRDDPLWSYFMACGFDRGYFGIQVNSPIERRVIFSVWDAGNEPVDRTKVATPDQVQLLAKGQGVFAGSFGNEGTGGHSHLIYPWKKGQTYKFLVTAKPDGTHTIYTGYFYFPEAKKWGLIASFRAPKAGQYLSGLYSFNEDFVGGNGQVRRRAEFGPGWIMDASGHWTELTTAHFSHDDHGKVDRKDYDAGVIDDHFFLSNGGFLAESPVKYGQVLTRPSSGKKPPHINLNGIELR